MTPDWAADYVGLPFRAHGRDRAGVDCWGLVRLVLAERFAVRLPSFAADYATVEDAEDIGRLIRGEMGPWREVPHGAERAGDVALLRLMNHPMHVGLVTAPGWMLHVEEGIDSCLDRYRSPKWHRRLMGLYRHESLMP